MGHGGAKEILEQTRKESQTKVFDLSVNLNPYGPPEWIRQHMNRHLEDVFQYPDHKDALDALATYYQCSSGQFMLGNGANELILALVRAFSKQHFYYCPPCYIDYKKSFEQTGVDFHPIPLQKDYSPNWLWIEKEVQEQGVVFLTNPNNPTGTLRTKKELLTQIQAFPNVIFVVDESFIDFVGEENSLCDSNLENLIIIRSMTKFYSIPGLRLGYVKAPPKTIGKLQSQIQDWNVNSLALSLVKPLLNDNVFKEESLEYLAKCRKKLLKVLEEYPVIKVKGSEGNFVLLHINHKTNDLYRHLINCGIILRRCEDFEGLNANYLRLCVPIEKALEQLKHGLSSFFHNTITPLPKRKIPSLMIQGTSSNAGKSLIAAAFCRIFQQEGIDVAPFKAQNMSLNSAVVDGGYEIARAQVLQAQAAKIKPNVLMNPVLLKPTSEKGSQVIVNGKVVGDIDARDFFQRKELLRNAIYQSYDDLSKQHDLIILEGAGSPAEVNLKKNDLVNMNMAVYAESKVLLVGDIDRGGVFASFLGTMNVFNQTERELMLGFLINKFRGEEALLKDALTYMHEATGIPVLGTIPYIQGLNLPDEDSVSLKGREGKFMNRKEGKIIVNVIDFPYISNSTDLDPFFMEDDVEIVFCREPDELSHGDLIILPGSKSVMKDCQFLEDKGLAKKIQEKVDHGIHVVGICGGMQILGNKIEDHHSVESNISEKTGLGILDISTYFQREKVLAEGIYKSVGSSESFSGYEIHHGVTEFGNVEPVMESTEQLVTIKHPEKMVWGTYLHGVFDNDPFRNQILNSIRKSKSINLKQSKYSVEKDLDTLADVVKASVNLDWMKKSLNI